MKTDKFTIEQLSEGFFELFEDGTFKKMNPKRLSNPMDDPTLGRYSSALGIDPLLITNGDQNIVVDPGLGWGLDHKSRYDNTSNIITNLNVFGLRPQDIHHVILTHLHFDHAAGSTFVNDQFKTEATFPNAMYYVHKEEWEYALTQIEKNHDLIGADYRMDELYKLVAENRLHFIEEDEFTVVQGVKLIKTGGHTPGHMIVKITDEEKVAYFMGDLVPTEFHLNQPSHPQTVLDTAKAHQAKKLILRKAYQEKAIMYFYHSLYKKTGQLAIDEKRRYVLKDE
ncbi:MBL fold metallo-hydrolase [Rhodohalobacter barkolensis]|uniref:Metallo-beta-lactamase domain-containing protein n=1 Tax=Rhodohalobacter barkolensis TaxID=2053187 RepID=A0A2N0VKQ9_9BACT|nr:MBL fold metallo-hydrolase [Rhodohalobacter barkolensis]PKD44762.1 hypothetical protein CWD77_04675 [Rhodohalobacter barkolensis]